MGRSKEQVEYNRQNYFTPGQGKETGLLQLLAGEEVDAEGSDFEPTQQDTQKRTPEDPIDDADSLSPPPLPPKVRLVSLGSSYCRALTAFTADTLQAYDPWQQGQGGRALATFCRAAARAPTRQVCAFRWSLERRR